MTPFRLVVVGTSPSLAGVLILVCLEMWGSKGEVEKAKAIR